MDIMVGPESKDFLDILIRIANQVRLLVLDATRDIRSSEAVKKRALDITRRIDLMAEKRIIQLLEREGIHALLISEEAGVRKVGGTPEVVLVVDPLDGTTNFANSIPFYSVSLAAGRYRTKPVIEELDSGVVQDVVSGDVFHAARGGGSYFNGREISGRPQNREEVLVSLYTYGSKDKVNYDRLYDLVKIRTLGSAALELCYVALGRMNAFVDMRGVLRLVDIAAAKIVLEEAGGTVTDAEGRPLRGELSKFYQGINLIAASRRELHRKLLRALS